MALFSQEELEALRRDDEEMDRTFRLTPEEIQQSKERDRLAKLDRLDNRDRRRKELKHKYWEANRERLTAYNHEYWLKYREANRERLSAYGREYRKANQERIAAYQREYYEAHRERIIAQIQERRARKKAAFQSDTPECS